MIKLVGIKKTFKTKLGISQALNGIDLHISKGEIFGIIGKSGAGKSTLLRTVNLLERPTEGDVILDGISLVSLKEKDLRNQRRNIGMIFQHFNLLNSATVFKNIALPLELAGINKKDIQNRVSYLLEVIGLSDKENNYPSQLSGGQKQRVAIARSLASNPKVLLCDEATSALDPETTKSILNLLKEVNEKFGVTILLITHEMDVVKTICDRVAVIENGKIVESSSMIEMFSNPKTIIAKSLVSSSFHISLPKTLENQLSMYPEIGLYPILKFMFIGNSNSEFIINTLIINFGLRINIIQAQVNIVKNAEISVMLCQVSGRNTEIDLALQSLSQSNIKIEVLGYVSGNVKYTA